MGFSVRLESKSGPHEALILREDLELRVLETMKRCLTNKVKLDKEYALALSSLAIQGLMKVEKGTDDEKVAAGASSSAASSSSSAVQSTPQIPSGQIGGSMVYKAWKGILEELDTNAKLLKENAEFIEKETLDKLNNLFQEKRKEKKRYQEEHSRITGKFNSVSDEVTRKKADYQKHLEFYRLMRSRFEEYYVKSGRGGRKLDEVRDKYQRACRRLHLVHNEFVLLLVEAEQMQRDLRSALLPTLLNQHQTALQSLLLNWRNIMKEITLQWNFTSRPFSESFGRAEAHIDGIIPSEEYADLLQKQISLPSEVIDFSFDGSLVEDTSGKLLANKLTVDNLTVEWIRGKLSETEPRIRDYQEKLSNKNPNLQELSELDVVEMKCEEKKLGRQLEVIKKALTELGCEEVPQCFDDIQIETVFEVNHDSKVESRRSLLDEEWFHGVLPREEVVRLLTKEGDFLVRETTRNDENQTVLSVCWGGHKHFIVQTTTEGQFRFEGPAFGTIQELILYQFKSGLPVTSRSGAILKQPIQRERWELNNDDVILLDKIGRGNFGDVYKGILRATDQEVAVKTCRVTVAEDNKRKFLQEGRILKQYDHPNVVKLIGICVQKQPIMIVMELVTGGSLLTHLRNNTSSLVTKQMLKMCRDAAAGMSYLESKNCIHRDLAARNCLVGEDNIVKISDFGMSREEEEYIVSDGMKQIPIKWTAPEALNFGKYTSLCDVWSYGVLCWEIFARGGTPYPGLSNSKAREKIDSGYRMPPPEGTPEEIYRLMLRCWEYQPENRPHFDQILAILDALYTAYR